MYELQFRLEETMDTLFDLSFKGYEILQALKSTSGTFFIFRCSRHEHTAVQTAEYVHTQKRESGPGVIISVLHVQFVSMFRFWSDPTFAYAILNEYDTCLQNLTRTEHM